MGKYKYKLKETSTISSNSGFASGQTGENVGASFGRGPKAGSKGVTNNMYTKKYKYKLVKEADPKRLKFQEERINAFTKITNKLNNLYPLLDNAKKETIAYYNDKPQSYDVVIPTDLILDYLNDIKKLLNPKQ
jgi:hypothetical protein